MKTKARRIDWQSLLSSFQHYHTVKMLFFSVMKSVSIVLIITVRCSYAMFEVELAGKHNQQNALCKVFPPIQLSMFTFIHSSIQQKFLTALGKSKQFFHCSPMLGLPIAALKGMFSFVRMWEVKGKITNIVDTPWVIEKDIDVFSFYCANQRSCRFFF